MAIKMYFGGSVVGKASTIGIEISPTPPLIFTGVKKCEIWRRLKLWLWDARIWKCSKISEFWNKSAMLRWSPYMSWPSLVKLSACTHEKALSVLTHLLKLTRKRAKSSITQPWIIRFRSSFAKSLNAWHP